MRTLSKIRHAVVVVVVVVVVVAVAVFLFATRALLPARKPAGPPAGGGGGCSARDFTIGRVPLDGVNGRDWIINGYVDDDRSPREIEDYRGNTGARARTYERHQGIDFDVPSFREMDSDSAVIHAIASGVVDEIIQDQPDRHTHCAGRWNFVRVRHDSGFRVIYGHIKRGSARVTVGQSVVAGTPLAIVGSAGCSTQPHVHVEVRDCAGAAIDALARPGMWKEPPDYDPPSRIMDVALRAGGAPTLDQIKDPSRNPALFAPEGTLGVGLSAALRGGDVVTLDLIAPDGTSSLQRLTVAAGAPLAHRYASAAFHLGRRVGRWTLAVSIDGLPAVRRAVTVAR